MSSDMHTMETKNFRQLIVDKAFQDVWVHSQHADKAGGSVARCNAMGGP